GVIQLTGVASRHVGIYIGGVLLALGLFPWVGAILQQIPKPVLGGATLVMFGSVAAAGIWSSRVGCAATPRPTPNEAAMISTLRRSIAVWPRMRMPAAAT
ncbi:solute carrier family 23 protein, partial [Pseudomonas aeruginosa]|uniref:solute carrier family 23 protein n=1 Tax=Pseudomonas aeruginosa TaxID=287 RepID=UPI0024B7389D